MPGQKSLFSYFSPKPPTKSGSSNDVKQSGTPKLFSENGSKSSSAKKGASSSAKLKTYGRKGKENCDRKSKDCNFNNLDVVWAKMESYPWWPGIICHHPTRKIPFKMEKGKRFVNIQFFDKTANRAWIAKNCVDTFTGSKAPECSSGGKFFSVDESVAAAAAEADEALEMNVSKRESLIKELPATSDEESDVMDVNDTSEDEDDEVEQKNGKDDADETKKSTKSRKEDKKRKRVVVHCSDDSEDDYKPESVASSDNDDLSAVDEAEISSIDPLSEEEEDSPVKKKPKKDSFKAASTPKPQKMLTSFASSANDSSLNSSYKESPAVHTKTVSKLSSFTAPSETSFAGEADVPRPHLKFAFLQPEKIRDAKMRRPSDEDYDPRTLHIPMEFKNSCTPGMRQWWIIKEQHFDVVLFFKMGKFYELFHMDADVAVKELGLIYMKGNNTHAGFPEIAYGKYSDILLRKGYKVARIEQTETPDMAADRCNAAIKKTKFDRVVRREVCQVTTPGTRTYSFLDGQSEDAASNFLLAVALKGSSSGVNADQMLGICFIDTSTSKFWIGQFADDRHFSRMRTLIAHYPPSQVLFERGKSSVFQPLFNSSLASTLKESLAPESEFWDSSKTLRVLSEEDYFLDDESKETVWPAVLKGMLSPSDSLGLTAADDSTLAVSALGAVMWYLRYCKTDIEMVSMKNFEKYQPVDLEDAEKLRLEPDDASTACMKNQTMVMDSVTLANLDILVNQSSGSTEGTLLEVTNHCSTPFGKRLFRHWLCNPLCDPTSIEDRLDAVTNLMSLTDIVGSAADVLRTLPDLERLLSKIHTLGNRKRSQDHPDSRAVLFEDGTYSKTKINNFLLTLNGFKSVIKVVELVQNQGEEISSKLLKKCCSYERDGGNVPELLEFLHYFDNAFDQEKAAKAGAIIPSTGYVPEYDESVDDIAEINAKLTRNLEVQKKNLGCKITYVGTAKNRFQMEVPDSAARRVPDSFEVTGQRKGFKRYWTEDVKMLLHDLMDAEDRRDVALRDTMRNIFNKFDQHHDSWNAALASMSVLDVLISMAHYSNTNEGVMCRPCVTSLKAGDKPFIEIREGRHPCALKTFSGGDFIPNDTLVGIKDAENSRDDTEGLMVLVTGPNMGGKSTLMRQVGLITVLAQMGCYVPAESCRMSPIDRIFTRLGASDRIMSGESTFFVELSEAASILHHASAHSLVLLDELGRGTATYDGTAIASAVVKHLSLDTPCRCLFSTHYHSLVEDFSGSPGIQLGHMACMVENETDDPSQETITFLYKFAEGACPKSYGFNAARLACLPEEVIQTGQAKAKEFEAMFEYKKVFRTAMNETVESTLALLQQHH